MLWTIILGIKVSKARRASRSDKPAVRLIGVE